MKNKLFSLILTICMALTCSVGLTACFEGPGEEADPNLYHLTLSTNLTFDAQQKAQLKATYGYGAPSKTVKEGVREESDVAQLKEAGATDADIQKAGKRQDDGSYYFFEQDPIYLEAPAIEGYKLLGFYDKSNDRLVINPILQDIDGGKYLPRYNMDSRAVELEARYEKWTYSISFDTMDEGDANPNNVSEYCYIDNPNLTLAPATTTSTFKTFVGWAYQDTANSAGAQAEWILLEKDGNNFKLPSTYYEEYMRITAVWEVKNFTITFAFEHYIDSETSEPLAFSEACEKILVHGNSSTVDGEPVYCETQEPKTEVTATSVLKTEYGSWLNIFPTATSDYNIWYCKVNGVRKDLSIDYFSFANKEITEDITITFVMTDVIE